MKPIISKSLSSSNKVSTPFGDKKLKTSALDKLSKSLGTPKPKLDKNIPEYTSYPSRFIYSVDIPEIKDLTVEFIYNFFIPDESTNDTDTLSSDSVERMNLSQNVISKRRYEFTEEELSINRSKLPRYVKINFIPPSSEKITYGTAKQSSVISENFDKIVKEENFSTSFFSALQFNNRELDSQTNIVFNAKKYSSVDESAVTDPTLRQVMSQQDLVENTIYKNGQGQKISNKYFESIKKLSTTMQVNSALLDDLVKSGAGNPLSPNFQNFKQYQSQASVNNIFNDYRITDSDYETSINYYKVIANTDSAQSPPRSVLLGYWIEKLEIFSDGTKKKFDPIIIESPQANSYIDFNVRYGATYVYEIRSIAEITYAAVDNKTYDVAMISSLIASRGISEYVETTENIDPPPPQDLSAYWDYDRVNPLTMEFNQSTNAPYPETGKRGCLFLTWNFPVNSQMDIKKFQLFRRKNLREPFELIKMFDFNDAVIKYPLLEEKINLDVIEYSNDPKKSHYDYDFMKKSQYIYAVCSIDAHGLSSNYSEQIAVKFDEYANKLVTEIISLAGAPKQYPNLYVLEDLFVDTMQTTSYKNMNLYFSPECYQVLNNDGQPFAIVGAQQKGFSYIFNFINVENQNSVRLDISVLDNRSTFKPYRKNQIDINNVTKIAIKKLNPNLNLKKVVKKPTKIKGFF